MSANLGKCQCILISTVGGVVTDSNSKPEYGEMLAKAEGFLAALNCSSRGVETLFMAE
jgi:anthranilate/para-aminobenzoate synthase component I